MDATIEQARDADWQADTSIVGTFIEFVTMGAAIGAAIWAKQAAQATKQGASATLDAVKHSREGNKIARESDRPWLDFEIIGDLQIRKFGSPEIWVGIKVPMNVTNYGKSPAIKPAMICKIIKGRVDSNETISVIAKQIQAGKGSASEPIFGGVTKFNWSNMSHAYEIDPEYGIRFDALDFFIGEFILFIVIGYTSNGTDFFYTGKLYSLNAEKYGCGSFIIEPEPTFGGYFTVVV